MLLRKKISDCIKFMVLTLIFGFGAFAANAQNNEEAHILVTKKGTEYEIVGWETHAEYNPDTYSFVYWDEPVMAKSTFVKNEIVPVSDFERPPVFDGFCLTEENPKAMFDCSAKKFNEYMDQESFNYPELALFADDEGKAYVTFTLDKDGIMRRMQVSMSEPCKGCAEAAADIIGSTEKMWFPAMMNGGKSVATKLTVPVRFRLKD